MSETWYFDHYIYRVGGPAEQEWYENGQKKSEEWRIYSRPHREDGPALQWWDINGNEKLRKNF